MAEAATGHEEAVGTKIADSGDGGQRFRLIADSDSDPSRTAFRATVLASVLNATIVGVAVFLLGRATWWLWAVNWLG